MISVHGKTLVRNFKQIVLDTYGIRLKVHQGFSMGQTADDDATVAAARSDGANEPSGSFTLWSTMSVQEAEDAIRDGMGFAVQVLDPTGANADNSAVLSSVGFSASKGASVSGSASNSQSPSPVRAWGQPVPPSMPPGTTAASEFSAAGPAKSKVAAGVLGILVGALGVHNFYLGFTGKGLAQLLISLLSCGALAVISSIWGLVEGIMILTGSIKCDARGVPLRD
jgi:TM2 domain-containing membrane protein YozV